MKHLRSKSTKYRLVSIGDPMEEWHACESCYYPAPLALFRQMLFAPNRSTHADIESHKLLCEVCSNSLISNDMESYHTMEVHRINRATAFCTNAVLDQMGAFDGFDVVTSEEIEAEREQMKKAREELTKDMRAQGTE